MRDHPIHPKDLAHLEALYDAHTVGRPGPQRWGGRVPDRFNRPGGPEQFGAWRAPTGGMITRGIYQPGGRYIPSEAGGQAASPRRGKRLLAMWRRRRKIRGPGVVGMGTISAPASPPAFTGGPMG